MSAVVRDPVCQMEIEKDRAAAERRRDGVRFWFCSRGCAELFDADPARYLAGGVAERKEFQLIIVGGGPAGLTAAVYGSIQQIETLLVADEIGGQAVESVGMENYMGFQVIHGRELVARFRDQLLHSHFVEHRLDRATALSAVEGRFRVRTERGSEFTATAVIVATGMEQRRLGVPGEERLLHRGVSFSIVQDAERFYGRDVAIVGGGNSGLQAARRLAPVARRLFLVSVGSLSGDAEEVRRARGVTNLSVLEHTVVREVLGAEKVEGIRVAPAGGGEARDIPVAGVFVEIGFRPCSGMAADLVERNERGEIFINADCSTRTPGLFAAGDVTTSYGKRVVVACGEGAKAALAAREYLARCRESTARLEPRRS